MKIAIISTMAECPWGGSEELWGQMAIKALTENHDVLALIPHWSPQSQKIQHLESLGLIVAEWTNKGTSILSNKIARLPKWYPYHELQHFNPEVICISHGGLLDIVNGHQLLAEFLSSNKFPYVIVIQANTELYQPNDQQRYILKIYFSNAHKVLFVSQKNLLVAKRQLASNIPNARVINNPVNLEEDDYVPWPNGNTPQLACVARLETFSKAQDVLFEVLAQQSWQERNWNLNIFGRGKNEQYLRDLATYFNISERIHWGYTNCVREIWKNNHILILPSRIEGTPLVLMEAMLCGRPSVVTDTGGNLEWIHNGKEGFTSESSSPRHLAHALENAWKHRSDWQTIGLNAREYFLKHHDPSPGDTLLACLIRATIPTRTPQVTLQNNNPLISIVIPCYNQAHYLIDSLQSVINQTYRNWECIVVNDGSTDNTSQLVREFQKLSNNIKLIEKQNGGVAQARNVGMQKCNGDWILPLDSDDILHRIYLESGISAYQKNPNINIITSHLQEFGESSNVGIPGVFDKNTILDYNTFLNSSMFKKYLFIQSGGYYEGLPWQLEDWNFWIELSKKGIIPYTIQMPLIHYRVTKNSAYKSLKPFFKEAKSFIITLHPQLYGKKIFFEAINTIKSMSTNSHSQLDKVILKHKNLIMPILWKSLDKKLTHVDTIQQRKYSDIIFYKHFFSYYNS